MIWLKNRRVRIAIFVLATAVTVSYGAQVFKISIQSAAAKAESEDRYADLQIFSKVLNLIQQYYVENVDTKKLIYGAIKGMLRELDPHTNFLTPENFKDFENETSGEFGGLGIEIAIQNGVLTIISPIEDTPADRAGIKPGDKVVAVDGKSTKGLSLVEASQLMRGKKGTKTVLSIVRETPDKPIDIEIVRGNVKIKSVKYTNLGDGLGYFRITSFIEGTSKDLEKYLDEHQKANKGETKGIVIDLRRNPGGLLEQAVKVSDLFLQEGVIVSTIGRDSENKEVAKATGTKARTDFPIIVLVNEYSASASEIVAGALQDNQRAIVMGTRSFGKGSVQSVVKLGDGSGLKLTVARYYTPSGKSIQAEGITPDIEIEDVDTSAFEKAVIKSNGSREKDIEGHLEGDSEKEQRLNKKAITGSWWPDAVGKKSEELSPKDKLLGEDYQVFQAFKYLKAWRLMKGRATKTL